MDYQALRQNPDEALRNAVRELAEIYSDKAHFVYELMQNADDAYEQSEIDQSVRLSFELRDGELWVWNDGRCFEDKDVTAICSVGRSTKDLTQIGSFGIGFKAVYAFTNCPEIYSGRFAFRIREDLAPEACEVLLPLQQWVKDGKTVFRLRFKPGIRVERVNNLRTKLRALGLRSLLFLRHLQQVTWSDRDDSGSYCRRSSGFESVACARRVTLTAEINDKVTETETWLVFSKPVRPPTSVIDELLSDAHDDEERERIHNSARKDQLVDVAFKLREERVVPCDDSVLFAYLPTGKEKTQLRFLVQARYQTTRGRESVPDGSPWNKWLVQETAQFLAKIFPQMLTQGLLTPDFFDVLPLEEDRVPDFLQPIVAAVQHTLKEGDFIPTCGAGHARPGLVFHASKIELRKLLTDEQLSQLTKTGGARWLHDDIRGGRRLGVVKAAGVRELTPEDLATYFTADFIESQPDEWVSRFYAFLKAHEHLWQAAFSGQQPGPLRDKKFIRLAGDVHVAPFGLGDRPQAYLPPSGQTDFPIVKRSLAADEQALAFLEKLGLKVPAIMDEVLEKVLPKYRSPSGCLPSEDEHSSDLEKIVGALESDCRPSERQRLEKALSEVAFLKATNPASQKREYRRPGEVYFPTKELETYFSGYANVWFLDESIRIEEEKFQRLMKPLGVEDKPRRKAFEPRFSSEKLMTMRAGLRSTRPHEDKLVDYKLEGLDEFLRDLPTRSPRGRISLSAVLWGFLLAYAPARSSLYPTTPDVFQGSYRWFNQRARRTQFDACFIMQLQTHRWLPTKDAELHKPFELSLFDLPDEFPKNEVLEGVLKMRPRDVDMLAKSINVPREVIELLRTQPALVEQLKKKAMITEAPAIEQIKPSAQRVGGETQDEVIIEAECTPEEAIENCRLWSTEDDEDSGRPTTGRAAQAAVGRQVSEAERRSLGSWGEGLVYQWERKRLIESGRADLAESVDWKSRENRSHPFDIASFENDGTPVDIEVKSTPFPSGDAGIISKGEWEYARQNPERHRLYIVYSAKSAKPVIRVLRFGEWAVEPCTYYIVPREAR